MLQAAVYDLCVAAPHEPADAKFTAEQFRIYRAGYAMALTIALRVMGHAEERYKLVTRTRRLEARKKRQAGHD